jgi:hypothetical protein
MNILSGSGSFLIILKEKPKVKSGHEQKKKVLHCRGNGGKM